MLKDEVLRSLTFIRLPERHLASQEELDIILQRFLTVVDEAQRNDLQTQFLDYQAMSDASLPHYTEEDGEKSKLMQSGVILRQSRIPIQGYLVSQYWYSLCEYCFLYHRAIPIVKVCLELCVRSAQMAGTI